MQLHLGLTEYVLVQKGKTLSSSVVNVSKGISTLVRISELHEGFSNRKKLRYDSIKEDQL